MNANTKPLAVTPTPAQSAKHRKDARWPPRSSRAVSKAQKLVCRYCGSDDLAQSFKKRRDARCRACSKQRYGSANRGKRVTRTGKAAK